METFTERYLAKQAHKKHIHFVVAIIALIAVSILLSIVVSFYIVRVGSSREVINCSSFKSYNEALQSYNAGNKKLDHNHNGVPCETLVKK